MSNKQNAQDAFMAKKAEIDGMLKRLQGLSDNHFNTPTDEINWSHVGDLGRYTEMLKQITDLAFGEGEYSE